METLAALLPLIFLGLVAFIAVTLAKGMKKAKQKKQELEEEK